MLAFAIPLAAVAIAAAIVLALWRLIRGPSATDRILALDTLSIDAIALVLLIGIATSSTVYFDVALLIAMLGFIATVALGKFLLGGDIIE